LFCELALRFRYYNRNDNFSEIIRQKVKPEIFRISQEGKFTRQQLIIAAAPAIYLEHPASAMPLINELPTHLRDEAFEDIASYILTKRVKGKDYSLKGM